LEGILLLELDTFSDERGHFREIFRDDAYRSAGISDVFVQENHSFSTSRVLRGMHFRARDPQAQIVTVIQGRIFDVVVDLRTESPTFGRWFGTELDQDGPQQLYMAPGFAHGFCVLGDSAHLHYKVSRRFDESDEAGFLWSDPDVGIRWPIDDPIVSTRDAGHPRFREVAGKLDH
jgi:dTDP-4-dehydrorhamnose 3,5-epimerase